jgi:hypothetical protein
MPMYRRIFAGLLLSGAAALAGAVTLPSDLMRPTPALAVRGYAERWMFSIEIESDDGAGIERCGKILAAHGLLQTLSKTASSADPVLHFKLSSNKEYAQADTEADDVLFAVQHANCPGRLTWTVASKLVPAAPPPVK